jgi:hypothetical protein
MVNRADTFPEGGLVRFFFYDYIGNPLGLLLVTAAVSVFAVLCGYAMRGRLWSAVSPPVGALVLFAMVLALLNSWAVATVRLDGDEPHYLVVTQSILRDGDFDLRNNYEAEQYLEYYPHRLKPETLRGHAVRVGEGWYPGHGIGLSVLAAPFFALGGRAGVVGMQTLATVAGLGVVWSLLRRRGVPPKAAVLATLVSGFTLPVVSQTAQIFPEPLAFLLVALGLRAALAPRLADWDLAGLVVSLAFLPWLHVKYLAVAGALLLAVALAHRPRQARGALAMATAALLVSATALAFVSYQWYGALLPVTGYARESRAFFSSTLGLGLIGVFFAQHYGLFFASPVYLVALAGIILLWRRDRSLVVILGIVFASIYLPLGIYRVWFSAVSSPARYLTPVVPVLACGIAAVLAAGGGLRWKSFIALAIPSFLHAYIMTALPSITRYGQSDTRQSLFVSMLEQRLGRDLSWLFPTFQGEAGAWLTMAVYLLGFIALTAFLVHGDTTSGDGAKPKPRLLGQAAAVAGTQDR